MKENKKTNVETWGGLSPADAERLKNMQGEPKTIIITDEDIKEICIKNGLKDPRDIANIIDGFSGDMRELKKRIEKYISDKEEIP